MTAGFSNGILESPATINSYTPTVIGSVTPGVGTYSTQDGQYLLLGDWVYVHMSMVWSLHTGAGNFAVSLPVAPVNFGNFIPQLSCTLDSITFPANTGNIVVDVVQATNRGDIIFSRDAAGATGITLPTSGGMRVSGWYAKA